jgi:hypothetical protein
MKKLNLVGQKFGRLTVHEFAGMNKRYQSMWNCLCDCGNTKRVLGVYLKNGDTRSCGCFKKEQITKGSTIHSHSRKELETRVYRTWKNIKQRCYNPKDKSYPNYGGRGIKLYLPWHTFENFYKDVGDIPVGMTFDRKDNNGDYEPKNWKFSTSVEQNNNRRDNVWLTYRGETKTIAQWAREVGMAMKTLWMRLNRGWSIEEALTIPLRGKTCLD